MVGRAAYDNPYLFAEVDQRLFGNDQAPPSRHEVVEAMLPYIDYWTGRGLKLNKITRHMLMLFAGQPGSRRWKQILTRGPASRELAWKWYSRRWMQCLSFVSESTTTSPPGSYPLRKS